MFDSKAPLLLFLRLLLLPRSRSLLSELKSFHAGRDFRASRGSLQPSLGLISLEIGTDDAVTVVSKMIALARVEFDALLCSLGSVFLSLFLSRVWLGRKGIRTKSGFR